MHVGGMETYWVLIIDTEWPVYDGYGRLTYDLILMRPDLALGEGEPPPEALWGRGARDVELLIRIFGIDPDARIWRKGSMYQPGDHLEPRLS